MADHELDLHGYIWSEAQKEFIDFYNRSLDEATGQNVVQLNVIHGYGSTGEGGVIQKRLRGLLEKHSDCLEFTLGESLDGNQGYTVVKPIKRLLSEDELLVEVILNYCKSPRTQSKITGKFRKHGDTKTIPAIRSLEKQGRLTKQGSGTPIKYMSS